VFLGLTSIAYAAAPVLFFTDMTNGPSSGLNDGYGQGTIVTLWGRNLGNSQAASTLTIGGIAPAHIYYWKNADGRLPGGPADLYTYSKMQEIAFSVPGTLTKGTYQIQLKVNGILSNTLPFTVRSGSIYYVSETGNNSTGDGSWVHPWKTVSRYTNGASTKIQPGDIVYVLDGVQEINSYSSGLTGIRIDYLVSGAMNQTAFAAYPNSRCTAQGDNQGIDSYKAKGIVISKYVIRIGNYDEPSVGDTTILHPGTARGIRPTASGRIVGNEITDIPGKCTSGEQGAISTNCASYDYLSDARILGNYIHDFGCDQTSKFQHTVYLSIRSNTITNVSPWELGWNVLKDNKSKYGLNNYDETYGTTCGNFSGTVKIHDNYVLNQRGPGINIGSRAADGSICWSGSFDVYNNILLNSGKGPKDEANAEEAAIRIGDRGMSSTIRIYNNTIYAYGDSYGGGGEAGIWFYTTSNYGHVTCSIKNNIIVDTQGYAFTNIDPGKYPHVSGDHNLWFSTKGTTASTISSCFLNNITGRNPAFVGVLSDNFDLSAGSPAIDVGMDTSGIVLHDFKGVTRPQNGLFDIGAYEYEQETRSVPVIKSVILAN